MKEISSGLYIGDDNDAEFILENKDLDKWAIVHAAKEPYHRRLLGYTGRGAPKDSPEYLWAERGNRLYMNIVDAPKSIFFDKGMIDKALDFIHKKLNEGLNVLVHCNEGFSRSPSIGLLYLIKHGLIKADLHNGVKKENIVDFEAEFLKIYPQYNPGTGIREFVKENWLCLVGWSSALKIGTKEFKVEKFSPEIYKAYENIRAISNANDTDYRDWNPHDDCPYCGLPNSELEYDLVIEDDDSRHDVVDCPKCRRRLFYEE